MLKKILFLALTAALMAGCHSSGAARTHYTGAATIRSGYYSPAPVVVYKPAPVAYRPAPPPPVYRAYSFAPPPRYAQSRPTPPPAPHRGPAHNPRR